MDNLNLMQRFADPELIQQMSITDKVFGSIIVAILGMMITFAVLCILWGLIAIMTKMMYKEPKKPTEVKEKPSQPESVTPIASEDDTDKEDEALIAVISAAIAASINRPVQSIVVKNIRRTGDRAPAWASVAKHEQLDSRRF